MSPGGGPDAQPDQISFGLAGEGAAGRAAGAGLAIETSGLAKRFRGQLAVAGIDLAVPQGAVYGFLGPNGAGKTTTIRMLLGLIEPTSGSHEMLGVPMPRGVNAVLVELAGGLVRTSQVVHAGQRVGVIGAEKFCPGEA